MTPAAERLLSVSASPAFWVAVVAYTAATAALLAVLGGHARLRALALVLVGIAFAAHGTDIGWRGTQHVHPAQSVREALGLLSFIVTGGYLIASARYRLTLGGAAVMPVSLVMEPVESTLTVNTRTLLVAVRPSTTPLLTDRTTAWLVPVSISPHGPATTLRA